MMDSTRFAAAASMDAWVEGAVKNAEFWRAAWRVTRADPDALARGRELGGRWYLVALAEDWCGDAINVLPTVARWSAEVEGVEFRVLGRDANPDLMDAHLTRGTRSIPVVIVYDGAFREVGWWGPRPAELQAWFYDEGKAMEQVARYRHLRNWYARDRGRTTLRELLAMMAAGAPGAPGAAGASPAAPAPR